MTTTLSNLSATSWRVIRLALSQALIAGHITQAQFDLAMTEIMGTSDKAQW